MVPCDDTLPIHVDRLLRPFVTEVLAHPHIQQPLERRQRIVCPLVRPLRCRHLLRRHVGKITHLRASSASRQEPRELAAPEVFLQRLPYLFHIRPDQRVAHLHVVIQEGKWARRA